MKTLDELHRTVGGELDLAVGSARNPRATCVGPVVTDSRRIEPGDLFWALAGPNHDGSDFAEEAFRRGAAGAVVDRIAAVPKDRWIIRVDDTQRALERYAVRIREKFTGKVIAVTGSVGKTTTRQMIHTVLRRRLRGTASPRNYNNRIGLPLSMLAMEPSDDYVVLELGASRAGEIAALAELCRPTMGVITRVADAHLAGFGNRLGVAQAKAELLTALPPDGHAVMGDDPLLRRLAACSRAPVTWIGCGVDCDVLATDVQSTGGRLCFGVDSCRFTVPVWGRHHLTSALLAVAASRLMGLELEEIAASLEQYEPIPMRCEVTQLHGTTIINDAYNANPDSMHAAFELLRDFDAPGRRIVVCGDMAELGVEARRYHHRLGAEVVTVCGADVLMACGEYAYEVVSGARAAGMPRSRSIPCQTPSDTLPFLRSMMAPGDAVLVKGSRWLNMDRLIETLQRQPRRRSA